MHLSHVASRVALVGAAALSLAIAAPGAAAAAGAPPAVHSAPIDRVPGGGPHGTVTSTNWAGYAASGGNGAFNSVSASWTQPAVSCATGETSYASFWVGLDGYTSRTVEQLGTDSDCRNGTPTYYAWYEMYPKLSGRISLPVSPGNAVTASVQANASGTFTLTLSSNGQSQTITGRNPRAARSSAEVIAEAPSSNHGPQGTLGLADFGTVSFSGATANAQPLADANPDELVMVTRSGTVKAQPSSLKGGSFSVTWKHP